MFGKTQVAHEPDGLNRVARRQGRTTPRASRTVDRPPEEWIAIPVPAIISADTFERAARPTGSAAATCRRVANPASIRSSTTAVSWSSTANSR
jgi:site-specific DNA recombinase